MKHTKALAALGGALITSIAAPATASAGPSAHAPRVVGHVYVDNNTVTSNSISVLNRYADGSLALAGAPVATGGDGLGKGLGSQGAVELAPGGKFLLAVDAGSNQVSVLKVAPSGQLSTLKTEPVSSHGVEPVSIAITPRGKHHDLVYVANGGDGGSNYTGFILDSTSGALRHLANSTIALADGSAPGDVLFNSTGTHLAGTRVGTALVDSFDVARSGRLIDAPGSPYAAQGPGPIGSEFRPTDASQLFVSNAHGGSGNGTVSAFKVFPDGAIGSIGSGPFPDRQTAPCWIEISSDGKYLFTSNTATPSISRYRIAQDGSLSLIGSTALTPAETGPTDERLAPNGKTLFVTEGGSDAVAAFAVHGGDLTELPGAPMALPVGASPVGLAVN